MTSLHDPRQNYLLAALPSLEFERLHPHLELIPLASGKMLYEAGGELQHVYFPTTSILSLHYITEDGSSAEVAGVGKEGMFGVSLFMGSNTIPRNASVQMAGHAYRLKENILMEEFNRAQGRRAGVMQSLLLRYTQALITQMSQTAVCNRHHLLDQQLCRWLLITLDRLPTNELVMTQEMVANILGVRREGVTEAAGKLQSAGIISYRRGHITVLNRRGLEDNACECYKVVKDEFDQLLSDFQKLHSSHSHLTRSDHIIEARK